MCLDCGCGKPNDNHGDPRHITMSQIEEAAKASGISPREAVQNIQSGFQQAQGGRQPGTSSLGAPSQQG